KRIRITAAGAPPIPLATAHRNESAGVAPVTASAGWAAWRRPIAPATTKSDITADQQPASTIPNRPPTATSRRRAAAAPHSTLIRPTIEKKPVKIGIDERCGGYGGTAFPANGSPLWKADTPGRTQIAVMVSNVKATGE